METNILNTDTGMRIETDYPGANIKVVSIQDHIIEMEQDLRDTTVWWFYWNFAMHLSEDFAGDITFKFLNGEVIGPWGPAVSYDNIKWHWLGNESLVSRSSFVYRPDKPHRVVYFAFSLPYQLSHFELFYQKFKENKFLNKNTLCVSEKGRQVPILTVGNPLAGQDIFITCRHHSCESIASYVLEGFLTHLLERDLPFMSPLLRHYMIHVVPFVDLDGVENGDQGKSRFPHDHNRDYTEKPAYKVTSAIMDYVKSLNLMIGIDIHSLFKWGELSDYPLFMRNLPQHDGEVKKLGNIFRAICQENPNKEKVVYEQIYDKFPWDPWGIQQSQNGTYSNIPEFIATARQGEDMSSNASGFYLQSGAKLGFTFETPYFGLENNKITAASALSIGRDFAKALEIYSVN
ncbi:MAG: M14 family zinc carboxypeptidase [Saccharofermentanales bacterium]